MNITIIDAVFYVKLIDFKNRRKNIKLFFITFKKIHTTLNKYKNLSIKKINSMKINALMKETMKKLFEKILEFLRKFAKILNSKKIENFFFRRSNDHKIEFTIDVFKLLKNKIYFLSFKKLKKFEKYLKKNLIKKFINFSKILFVFFIFFVFKSNDELRMCVDYRKFDVITKRNDYSISLIKKTLIKIINCKYISKLNIIVAFNKLRMIENNENFITFICFLKIYKYHVLFFDFINDFVNWQQYMNDMFFEFINKFCQIYLNDIFIYNKSRKKHQRHLKQMFIKLKIVEFQMNIRKCEFFQIEIKFFEMILFIDELRMNFEKIIVIINWITFIYLKKIQIFVERILQFLSKIYQNFLAYN